MLRHSSNSRCGTWRARRQAGASSSSSSSSRRTEARRRQAEWEESQALPQALPRDQCSRRRRPQESCQQAQARRHNARPGPPTRLLLLSRVQVCVGGEMQLLPAYVGCVGGLRMRIRAHTHTRTRTNTNLRTLELMDVYTYIYLRVYIHVYDTYVCIHTHVHMYHAYIYIHMHIHAKAFALKHTHSQKKKEMAWRRSAHAYMQAHTFRLSEQARTGGI
jgi:hypothetical protein